MPRLTERELLDHIKGYHDQMIEMTEKTANQVNVLKDALAVVNDQKDTLWSKLKPYIPVVIIVLAILGILLMKPAGVCQVSISVEKGFSVNRCEQKKNKARFLVKRNPALWVL
jgi:phage-related minor tail protein